MSTNSAARGDQEDQEDGQSRSASAFASLNAFCEQIVSFVGTSFNRTEREHLVKRFEEQLEQLGNTLDADTFGARSFLFVHLLSAPSSSFAQIVGTDNIPSAARFLASN